MALSAISDYLRAIRATREGAATEHSYRPALKALLEEIGSGVVATNEPPHRSDCGAPDMSVTDGPGREALIDVRGSPLQDSRFWLRT
jgi:hypothetical protein